MTEGAENFDISEILASKLIDEVRNEDKNKDDLIIKSERKYRRRLHKRIKNKLTPEQQLENKKNYDESFDETIGEILAFELIDEIRNEDEIVEEKKKKAVNLVAPKEVIDAAKSTMGAIDLDPYVTRDNNRQVQASRYFDRDQESVADIINRDWDAGESGRVFLAPVTTARDTRSLLNKLLREYRSGTVKEAVIWLNQNESLTRMPWLWSFPVCVPFKRLRPTWYDDELDEFRSVSTAFWSPVIYMPPVVAPVLGFDSGQLHAERLSRFYSAFSLVGRIVYDSESGSDDWEKAYKAVTGRAFNYR